MGRYNEDVFDCRKCGQTIVYEPSNEEIVKCENCGMVHKISDRDMKITEKQIEQIKKYYEIACKTQSSRPYEEYDPTEIQTIITICNILNINLN